MSILVTTPNGQIGRRLSNAILDAGVPLTIISRRAETSQELTRRGARLIEGAVEDASTLERATEGVDTIFWLTPPNAIPGFLDWAREIAARAAEIAKKNGVQRAIVLSSIGAQHPAGTGPIVAVHRAEIEFAKRFEHQRNLRPAYFMENYRRDLPTIAAAGRLYSAMSPDHPFPTVATADIADVAARVALDQAFEGQANVGIHGPRDLSLREQVAELSLGLGRAIELVSVGIDAARAGMRQAGMPDFLVDLYSELIEGANRGLVAADEPRSAATTTPTELRDFAARVLRPELEAL